MKRNLRFLVFFPAEEFSYAFDPSLVDDKDIKHSAGFAPSRGLFSSGNLFHVVQELEEHDPRKHR